MKVSVAHLVFMTDSSSRCVHLDDNPAASQVGPVGVLRAGL